MSALDSPANLHVSPALDWLGRYVGNHPRIWTAFGDFETALLAGDLDDVPIEKPVYICGLARAGSTILLETLATQRNVATHRYQDFPFLFTPYWWNLLLKLTPWRNRQKRERAHGDRILIGPESPEAMEEMLWMAFFPHLHQAKRSEILDTAAGNPAFDRFYRDHIRKLLLIRKAARYISKGNYNVTRMAYIHFLFPDARFIIPIREPASHIASLMRQHQRFCAAGRKDPRVTRHMSLAGHFEFGLNRMPTHTGDEKKMLSIQEAWDRGEEVRGWALYWDAIYQFAHHQLEADAALKERALVVRFENLCKEPARMLRRIFDHAGFSVNEPELAGLASSISAPDYYHSPLTGADTALIRDITGATAARYGY